MKTFEEIKEIFKYDSTFDSFAVENLLGEELFEKIKNQILWEYGPESPKQPSFDRRFGRWQTENALTQEFLDHSSEIATKLTGTLYKNTGNYSVKYKEHEGHTPYLHRHVDTNGGNITIGLVIENNVEWSLGLGDKLYAENIPGNAVIFNGQKVEHWRPEWPTQDPDASMLILFMMFAEPDHWYFALGKDYEKVFSKIQGYDQHMHDVGFDVEKHQKEIVDLYTAITLLKQVNEEENCPRTAEFEQLEKVKNRAYEIPGREHLGIYEAMKGDNPITEEQVSSRVIDDVSDIIKEV